MSEVFNWWERSVKYFFVEFSVKELKFCWRQLNLFYILVHLSLDDIHQRYAFWQFPHVFTEVDAHLAGGRRGPGPALFRYHPNCALKFLDKFRRSALKDQFKKQKRPSKRCTNSILLKVFNTTLRKISVALTGKNNLFSLNFT